MLAGEGYRCHTANAVKVALAQLTQHPEIALVITDLRMPAESGFRLIQRLREHPNRQYLPIIVTSGHAEIDDVVEALRLHVLDFFRKSIYYERLLSTLGRLLLQPQLQVVQN
ncbi:response regulator [Pseudomonas cavernae]|uniref:Response regulator n=1 Tax=Pseudomonas cavernae TaxID=2320867 RepID=A0A385Z9R2_9PSED|nr:response regulator [Pseudomonas cavernae]AYC34993.1 response regulator [Pseudomonas cavernae]